MQGQHRMETMGRLLRMAAHPKRPKRHQGPNPLPINIRSQGLHRRPCSQPQSHPQNNCGAIYPLRGTDLCGRGGPRPKTQHHGRHRFLPETEVCDLHEKISSPRNSTPPPCIHPPLHGLSCPRWISERESNRRPRLDCILIPPPTKGILYGRNRHSLHPLHSSRHPVLCGNPTHPLHQSFPFHLCLRRLR